MLATDEVLCEVLYSATSDMHEGQCKLPSTTVGAYELEISVNEELVGGEPVAFEVTRCGPEYYYSPGNAQCQPCDSGMDCSAPGNTLHEIMMKKDYWRADMRSHNVYECRLDGACPPGMNVGEAVCAEGYEGAACGSCTFPTHYLSMGTKCEKCNSGAEAIVWIVSSVVIVLLFGFGSAASYYADRKMVKVKASQTYRFVSPARLKILW